MAAEKYTAFYREYDGRIVLASNRQRGIWSYQSIIRDRKMLKVAGSMSRASHDTLLTVAICSAVSAINTHHLATKTGKAKPRIQVVTSHAPFAELMTAALTSKKDPRRNGFKCAAQFVMPLFRQLVKFDLEFIVEDADNQLKLRQWAANMLSRDSHVFAPQAIQEI